MNDKWKNNIELKKKLQRLDELAKVIELHIGQTLTREKKQEMENWKDKMEFRLNSLVLVAKIKEADIKIEIYEKITDIINK